MRFLTVLHIPEGHVGKSPAFERIPLICLPKYLFLISALTPNALKIRPDDEELATCVLTCLGTSNLLRRIPLSVEYTVKTFTCDQYGTSKAKCDWQTLKAISDD